MANNKIPVGYQGTYAKDANGDSTLIMVSRNVNDTAEKPKKEQSKMEEERQPYTPYTKEQKQEYAKNFTPEQIKSYRKGQQSAYAHMGNIGKRNSFFIYDNLNKDAQAAPQQSAKPPKRGK